MMPNKITTDNKLYKLCQTVDANYDAKRHPNPIRRFSSMHWTDRRTDAQTDRSFTGKFDHYRPMLYESDAA